MNQKTIDDHHPSQQDTKDRFARMFHLTGSDRPVRCLFVHPEFTSKSFWNFRETCRLIGARYPASPLGLVTVAALCPKSWDVRMIDMNCQKLKDEDIRWADMVFSGGMISQQSEHLNLIARVKAFKKVHIVGGPDPTSSPHVYSDADHLVLGEAEITMPEFLEDLLAGQAKHKYEAGEKKADMQKSPMPRYDLLTFHHYTNIGVQFARGCPFKCEFCDIIELFGRVPRQKDSHQLLKELDRLRELGYRGPVDIVDDNFIGNRKGVREMLSDLHAWQQSRGFPFEFYVQSTINLSDDESLMNIMQKAGFFGVFVGIETPNQEALEGAQKKQNMRRSIPDSIQKMYRHGFLVTAGYILGFDDEPAGVNKQMIKCIEDTSIAINMVGLLVALPGTQLSRRLKKEGRLDDDFEYATSRQERDGDQGVSGLNFMTKRPKEEILQEFRRVVSEAYDAKNYFARLARVALVLNCKDKKLGLTIKYHLRSLGAFFKLVYREGIQSSYRRYFWKTLFTCVTKNPRALRYIGGMMGMYLHFGPFKDYLVEVTSQRIVEQQDSAEAVSGLSV